MVESQLALQYVSVTHSRAASLQRGIVSAVGVTHRTQSEEIEVSGLSV